MFIGHFAPALVAATDRKAPSLGVLFLAAQFVDIVLGFFLLTGIEPVGPVGSIGSIAAMTALDLYPLPFSHSLLATCFWAATFAVPVYLVSRRKEAALIAAAVVLSHWLLDLLVHRDLTLAGGDPRMGVALWDMPLLTIAVELALIGGAFFYYIRHTRPRLGRGHGRIYILVGVLLALQILNWFGPQPTEQSPVVALVMIATFVLLAALANWAAQGRRPRRFRRGFL